MIIFFSVRNSIFNYYKVLSLIYRLGWIYNKEKLFTGKSKEFFTSHILHRKKYKPVRAWGGWLLFLSLERAGRDFIKIHAKFNKPSKANQYLVK